MYNNAQKTSRGQKPEQQRPSGAYAQGYSRWNERDEAEPINRNMSKEEREEFRKILAVSYKLPPERWSEITYKIKPIIDMEGNKATDFVYVVYFKLQRKRNGDVIERPIHKLTIKIPKETKSKVEQLFLNQ